MDIKAIARGFAAGRIAAMESAQGLGPGLDDKNLNVAIGHAIIAEDVAESAKAASFGNTGFQARSLSKLAPLPTVPEPNT